MGLNSDAHSPNEHFGIFNLKGIETIPLFYKYFVELSINVLTSTYKIRSEGGFFFLVAELLI
jgi:hypothetical protein